MSINCDKSYTQLPGNLHKGISSADEVDDNQVKHGVGEEEVCEGSFRRDG